MTARSKLTPTQARKARAASAHGARIKKAYGLTRDDYAAVLAYQGGCCSICGGKRPYRLCVDHDHATGEVRGLLCRRCNKILRDVRDSDAVLVAAAAYLNFPPVREALGSPRYVPVTEVTT